MARPPTVENLQQRHVTEVPADLVRRGLENPQTRNRLYVFLKSLKAFTAGIPGGFFGSKPPLSILGTSADLDAGTALAGWMAANAQQVLGAAAPANPTGPAAAEGTALTALRSDCVVKQGVVNAKGDLLGFSSVPARVPVGTNTYVLTADSAQALGVKWAPSADADAEFLAWIM